MTLIENDPLKIYIGWDSREDIAYQVAKQSILEHASVPVHIVPLKQKNLKRDNFYWRGEDKLASTEFTFTRFLVPALRNFKGWALFIDCDFVALDNVKKLFDQRDDKYAVMCAHHNYTPKEGVKMDGKTQTVYPRKNWSSMMLINCGHPSNQVLTKDFVNDPTIDGKYLHRFSWLKDNEVGEISHEWNWLVGWYKEPNDGKPKFLHYTEGGPWFKEYEDCEYANEYYKVERRYLMTTTPKLKFKPVLVDDLDLPDDLKYSIENKIHKLIDPEGNYYGKKDIEMKKVKSAAIFNDELIYPEGGRMYDDYLEAFTTGIGGKLSDWDREQSTDVPLIMRGLGSNSRRAIRHCWDTNREFYAIDTGYFGNAKIKYWHRITKNALQHMGPIIDRPNDRLTAIGGYSYKKLSKGNKILICPPSGKVMEVFNQLDPDTWVKQVVKELKQYTDRPIQIRMKPIRHDRVSNDTMEQALADNVYCLVTYNSIAATEALMFGKPAIALGPNSAQVICNTALSEIDNLVYPDQDTMDAYMRHLSYCQFTIKEMLNGTAWRIINESS